MEYREGSTRAFVHGASSAADAETAVDFQPIPSAHEPLKEGEVTPAVARGESGFFDPLNAPLPPPGQGADRPGQAGAAAAASNVSRKRKDPQDESDVFYGPHPPMGLALANSDRMPAHLHGGASQHSAQARRKRAQTDGSANEFKRRGCEVGTVCA